jgi:hypothetical protein
MVSTHPPSTASNRYLSQVEPDAAGSGRGRLAEWLEDVGGEDAVLTRDVRAVLVSGGFGREITTTVLWLNEVYGLDIQCVRLTPYKIGERLLLDVQQVIPLPEAADLTIQLRRRETHARAARDSEGRDWTPYVITTPKRTTEPLRKRHAVLALVSGLHEAGVPGTLLAEALPGARFLSLPGSHADDDLVDAFVARYPKAKRARWFFESPLREADQTWFLSKMWGRSTERVLAKLVELAPEGMTFGYEAQSRD